MKRRSTGNLGKLICTLIFFSLFVFATTLSGYAHTVNSYSPNCGAGPQYSVTANMANNNNSSNYRWQWKNNSGSWICFVNGNNTVNGNTYNVTGAVVNLSNLTTQTITITNPNSGLQGLEIRIVISDGSGVNPCTLPSGNTWTSSTNHFIHITGTACASCTGKVTGLYFNELAGGADLTITNGSTFTVAQLASLYNLEAITTGTVGSVKFTITGPTATSNTENTAPYNSPGTGNGAWTGAVGTYSVNLKTYNAADASGTQCHDTTITFILTTTTFNCNCTGTNVVLNPGFESGISNWSFSGGTLSQGNGAVACGSFSGDLNNTSATSKAWQNIGTNLATGTVVNVSVYAGVHDNSFNNFVAVEFLNASNVVLGTSVYVQVDKVLANAPAGPQLYTFTATVPTGTTTTRVAFGGNGTWTKTDRWCVTLTAPTGSIGDRVWFDANGNGIQDASETTPITGVTVQLKNAAGTVIATTTTNATGNYLFSGLAAGNYTVVFPASINGAVVTNPNVGADDNIDSDASQTTGETGTIVLGAGQNITSVDAGYCPTNLSLGDRVYFDLNNNGIREAATEAGIPSLTVNLYKDNNNDNIPDAAAVATVITDANGGYRFDNLVPGNYIVGVTPPATYTSSTLTGVDPDNNLDLDDNGTNLISSEWRGLSITLTGGGETLESGNFNNTYDFGFYQPAILSLGNNVWFDQNNDGIKQATETGIANVTVNLYTDNDDDNYPDTTAAGDEILLATTITDAAGNYIFNNLTPKNYIIGVITPSGYMMVATNGGDPDDNINLDNNGIYSISGGETFGLAITLAYSTEPNGASTNTNYNDTYDFGFSSSSMSPTFCTGTLLTNANGYYGGFEIIPASQNLGTASNPNPAGSELTLVFSGNISADKAIIASNGRSIPGGISLPPHSGNWLLLLHPKRNNERLWFKSVSVTPGSTYTFCAWGAGSKATPATMTLNLVMNAVNVGTGTITNAGTWTQVCGTYTVPAGVTTMEISIKDPTAGDGGPSHFVALDDICFTEVANLNLGNTVWYDQNNDGIRQATETGIAGATVKLYADANNDNIADGAAIATTTTNASGVYNFTSLVGGNYIVGVTIPTGYAAVTTNGGDPDNNTDNDNNGTNTSVPGEVRSSSITLASGTEPTTDGDGTNGNLTLDIALRGTGSIGDFVWNDVNRNGIQDATEIGIPNATVTLTYPNGSTAVTTTNAAGAYSFANLAPETYSLSFATPAGFLPTLSNVTGGAATDDNDSDPVGGIVSNIIITPGAVNNSIDAGFYAILSLSGNVWNDVNGMNDNLVNNSGAAQTPPATTVPTGMRIILVDANTGLVVGNALVLGNGTYNFSNVKPAFYTLVLSTVPGTIGSLPPAYASLPTGWINTGEKLGLTPGRDAAVNGKLSAAVNTVSVINANFGIQQNNSDIGIN